jgi:hypothetical protein
VEYSFAYPVLEQAKYVQDRVKYKLDVEQLLQHALGVNVIMKGLVEKSIDGNVTGKEIYADGLILADAHKMLNLKEFFYPDWESVLCAVYTIMWKQMIETCNYKDWEEDYKSVA